MGEGARSGPEGREGPDGSLGEPTDDTDADDDPPVGEPNADQHTRGTNPHRDSGRGPEADRDSGEPSRGGPREGSGRTHGDRSSGPPGERPTGDPDGTDPRVLVVGDLAGPDPGSPPWAEGRTPDGLGVEVAASLDRARRAAASGRVDGVVVGSDPPETDQSAAVEAVREVATDVPVVLVAEGGVVPAAAVSAGVDGCLSREEALDPGAFARTVRSTLPPPGGNEAGTERAGTDPGDGEGTEVDGAAGIRIGASDEAVPESLSTLFETLPMPVAETVVVDDEAVVAAVNPAFENTFGHDAEGAVGESLDDLVVPEDRREAATELTRRSAAGDSLDVRVRRETPEGIREFILRFAPLPGESDPVRGYAIYVDVTDRAEYERVLTRLHDVTRDLMVAETPEEIARVGVETTREILGLPYATAYLYDEDEHVLDPVAVTEPSRETFGPPPQFDPGRGIAGEVFQTGERVLLEDGQKDERRREDAPAGIRSYCVIPLGKFGVVTISSPEVGEIDERDAEVAGILGANVQAALRRADREARLREREREVRRQNERLDRVASVMSHDLRNPLEVARANLGLARADDTDLDDRDHLGEVEAALDRMGAIVEDALELARQGEAVVDPDTVEFEDAVRGAWAAVDAPDASLRVETERSFRADDARLRRLLENLFRNAVEHGSTGHPPEDGDSVDHGSTGNRPEAGNPVERGRGEVTVTVEAIPGGFAVQDDGPGIDPEHRESVFEPGYTTAPDGTGLGLNIAREIARAHGWEIRVAESGEGARFEVTGVGSVGE